MNPPSYLNTVQGPTQLYEIISSTEIELGDPAVGQNKWRYVVSPVSLQVIVADTAPVKGVSSDQTYVTAWNVYETQNSDTNAMGVDPTSSAIPADFELYPIPIGAVVPGWYYQGGDQLCIFVAWPNQFEGSCDP